MSEEKEKPVTITIQITMPTKEVIASAIQKLFPCSNLYDFKVSIEEEKKPTEIPPKVTTPDENVNNPECRVDPPGPPFKPLKTREEEKKPGESP